ncbi:hypothetical protein DYB30_011573 [Aphanomyces astaci]|uniref:Uncharacterized protein n=1 Tax=Aphanomyces astaci TaxID=112090 RepID=A0A397CRF0_APHAT|nr:hypothetical protein DYB30_011573 [Aphanomyces astaci]
MVTISLGAFYISSGRTSVAFTAFVLTLSLGSLCIASGRTSVALTGRNSKQVFKGVADRSTKGMRGIGIISRKTVVVVGIVACVVWWVIVGRGIVVASVCPTIVVSTLPILTAGVAGIFLW